MGRFSRLLVSLAPLALCLPLWAQQPLETDSNAPVRIPPPPETFTSPELEQQADALRAQKAYLDAVDYYRAAIRKSDSAVLHNKVGMCMLQMRRNAEAKREFQRAIRADKNYAEAYNNMGALYYNMRKYGAAIHEYKKAIRLHDASASFHSNLGGAYFSEKDFDNAVKEYQRAIALDPDIFLRQSSASAISIRLVGSNDLGHFHYVMAQMYGQHGDEKRCRYYLSKANEEGYPIKSALHDNEFAGLRKDPNFISFVRALKPPSADAN